MDQRVFGKGGLEVKSDRHRDIKDSKRGIGIEI
jgi:hypothetical protein